MSGMKEAHELYEAMKAAGAFTELHTLEDVEQAYRRFGEIVGVPYFEDHFRGTWNIEEMMAAWRARNVS